MQLSADIYFVMPEESNQSIFLHHIFSDLLTGFKRNGLKLIGVVLSSKNEGIDDVANVIFLSNDNFKQFYESNPSIYFVNDELNLLNKFYEKKLPNLPIYVTNFVGYQFVYTRYIEWMTCNNLDTKLRRILLKYIPNQLCYNYFYKQYLNVLSHSPIFALSVSQALNIGRIVNFPVSGIFNPPIDAKQFFSKPKKKNKVVIYLGNCTETNVIDLINILIKTKEIVNEFEVVSIGNNIVRDFVSKKTGMLINHYPFLERPKLYELFAEAIFFINPIFNGDFEVMPIEALLSGTPVVSYTLPFLEVTGQSLLIANIENYNEVKQKIKIWIGNDLTEEIQELKRKVLSAMDCQIVAKRIYDSLSLIQ